jgi:adenylosuccinate lyase
MELETLSPLDGRYRQRSAELLPFFSEQALFKYRVFVETEYLIHFLNLTRISKIPTKKYTAGLKKISRTNTADFTLFKKFETIGYKRIKATNHDIKAVEYFIKEKLKQQGLSEISNYVHFALTSDDVNNIAYALALSDALEATIIPKISILRTQLSALAKKNRGSVMLARTHGQPATPTTFGKEMNVFANRLEKKLQILSSSSLGAKLNGATGTYAAHIVAFPEFNWLKFSKSFIESLNKGRKLKLIPTLVTTQIEPHDRMIEVFDCIKHINNILIGLDQDVWNYISRGLVVQRAKRGEAGSSTMPHKVNPIDFENSEGNLGIANALLAFMVNKLPISRLQRDLSDSTVLRNIGVALGYSLVAYKSLSKGLGKISFNTSEAAQELDDHPEILTEAIQVILKKKGIPNAYEKLKDRSRGKKITLEDLHKWLGELKLDEETKARLQKLKPSDYIGLAKVLATLREQTD